MPLDYGTTATCGIVFGNTLIVGNVGDSKAILISSKDGKNFETTDLTIDHGPRNEDEVVRVKKDTNGKTTFSEGYLIAESTGHQLAVTRALGHKILSNHGVSPEPHIKTLTLSPNDLYLVFASDGVWEALTKEEIVNIVSKSRDPISAADKLVKESLDSSPNADDDLDNTTAIIVFLKYIQ